MKTAFHTTLLCTIGLGALLGCQAGPVPAVPALPVAAAAVAQIGLADAPAPFIGTAAPRRDAVNPLVSGFEEFYIQFLNSKLDDTHKGIAKAIDKDTANDAAPADFVDVDLNHTTYSSHTITRIFPPTADGRPRKDDPNFQRPAYKGPYTSDHATSFEFDVPTADYLYVTGIELRGTYPTWMKVNGKFMVRGGAPRVQRTYVFAPGDRVIFSYVHPPVIYGTFYGYLMPVGFGEPK